ncbi:hypothetical protein ACJH6H_26580, partial [Mycobacterium sp. SMC-21]|uniref:hypothetical protein n=1 Tax=Mycobacterium sp. SMC-21 TaxID=3381632 RepID=UPI003876C019
MEPRALKRLVNVPVRARNKVVAEGLDMLALHVERLVADAALMHENGRAESGAVLDNVAGEQAASNCQYLWIGVFQATSVPVGVAGLSA